jgi:uncharacterized protein (DUF1778 family)
MRRAAQYAARRAKPARRQISAQVARTTCELLERHSAQTGIKKGHLVEQALLHHLHVLDELPPDAIIPPRVVVTDEAGRSLLEEIESPAEPTRGLRALMGRHGR